MSEPHRQWSEYWTTDGASGEVFVNARGEKHPYLAEYWKKKFEGLEKGDRIIDLASGAGSVFGQLPDDHGLDLHAVDVSLEALGVLRSRIPGTTTVVCAADSVPYQDHMFDLVVSQFGIEYAGIEAFGEAARLVSRGGSLIALCHIRDGYIDSNNRAQLAEAMLAVETGFIDKAIALSEAAFSTDNDAQAKARGEFIPAERQLAAAVARQKIGIHAHLYQGFRQLFEERQCYALSDITNWLSEMRADLDRNIDRLTRIREVALSADDMIRVEEMLTAQGLQDVSYGSFETPGNDMPVAWELSANRD
jgi:SAM-dependent methyltransferase